MHKWKNRMETCHVTIISTMYQSHVFGALCDFATALYHTDTFVGLWSHYSNELSPGNLSLTHTLEFRKMRL